MKLFIGGVRGGRPVIDAEFARYGGDTTSYLIEGQAGERLIIDAGSGLIPVYERLCASSPSTRHVCLLFSHYHHDHMMGLPSFLPLYSEEWTIELAARIFDELTVEDVAHSYINPPFWPVSLEDMGAALRFRIFDDESMERASAYGGLEIRWCPLRHRGGSTAFRIDEPATGASIVIATDVEWSESDEEEREWLRKLVTEPSPVDWLLFDGQLDDAEYEHYRGWGHSTWQQGVQLAAEWGVEHAIITHHAADLNDQHADKREQAIRGQSANARLAKQGELIELIRSS